MHQNIYSAHANSLAAMGKTLDDGVSALLADLKASGQLDETLVVMVGEFGRTVGKITAGGRARSLSAAIGDLRRRGRQGRPGHRLDRRDRRELHSITAGLAARDIKPEDIEATIYSAMGINWTNVRYDDPFGRGFEYVPFSDEDLTARSTNSGVRYLAS